jgi:putative transposase
MKFVPWRDYKEVAADLKRVYQSATKEEALHELNQLDEKWTFKYPQISRSWRQNWDNLNTLFAYPSEIRKAIYITNAIESLNSVIRKAMKKRKLFPHDDAAKKVVSLATREASKKWTMPIRNWRSALNHLMIVFEERLSDHV